MSVLGNDPVILSSVIGGVAFLVALKVVAFLAVRRVMKRPPVQADDTGAGDRGEDELAVPSASREERAGEAAAGGV